MAQQVAALAGCPVPLRVVDELYARAEGNPFFTEQLVAAGLADGAGGGLGVPAGLPGRLAELLAARAGRCAGDARAVLAGLAVAGRPLAEDLLGVVTGLDAEAVRGGLRELAAARLLAEDTAGGGHRPRHALLAEAVAGGLLPGERAALHERTARALAAAGRPALAAEVAGHWQAAGNPAEELPARVAAAEAAERVFGYAEAAVHWQRAIELAQAQPGCRRAAGTDVPHMYVRAIDALYLAGDGERAAVVAEEAYRRFADHPDPATAAAVRHRAAFHRAIDAPAAGLPLMEEALRLYEQAPPSAEHAKAQLDYADMFLRSAQGRPEDIFPALNRALEIAEAAGATALIPRILASLAEDAFVRGQVEEGFALLERGWALARASDDGLALARLAVNESDALLKLARFQNAADVALSGLGPARQAGLQASLIATVLAFNASEALLALGRTAEAAALIDPLTTGPPDRLHWLVHEARAEIDLLRGDIDAAAGRRQQIDALLAHSGHVAPSSPASRRSGPRSWRCGRAPRRRPGRGPAGAPAVQDARPVDLLRAAAGGGHARLRRPGRTGPGTPRRARRRGRRAAADGLASWAGQVSGAPFTGHPFVATIPAERATWDAERTRLAGVSDPEAWRAAAQAWEGLGCPHRAGYAWWRQAQAQLDAGQPAAAAAALRAAAAAADGHAPLLAQVRALAERARIPLQPPAAAPPQTPPPAAARRRTG